MELGKEYLGPFWEFVREDEITDIDYNGSQVWLTTVENERILALDSFVEKQITSMFVEQFTNRIANLMSQQFHKRSPVLEAETPDLRVTILHESIAKNGRTISIRKTPPIVRLNANKALLEHYCPKEILCFLVNLVLAHMNLVFCGMPGAGKTEAIKFLSQYIPANERVVTIEDTLELRYALSNPGKDCVELKVKEGLFDYALAIKSSLRLNPRWIMLSEARSSEVKYLLESWSTGVCGMTTLHTDDVRNVPDRILSMLENRADADRLENDIYEFIDVAVLLRKKKNEEGRSYRYIDQLGLYTREKGENKIVMLVRNGQLTNEAIPHLVAEKFRRSGINDPFYCDLLAKELEEVKR